LHRFSRSVHRGCPIRREQPAHRSCVSKSHTRLGRTSILPLRAAFNLLNLLAASPLPGDPCLTRADPPPRHSRAEDLDPALPAEPVKGYMFIRIRLSKTLVPTLRPPRKAP